MLLRRLSSRGHCPALCGGPPARGTCFAAFAAQLADELEKLRRHPVRLMPDGVFPLELLLAFAPARRVEILNGRPARADWEHVAAVRLAQLISGIRFPLRRADFDRETAQWACRAVSRASGPAQFARDVLTGRSGDVRCLTEPAVLHHAKLVRFLARGSTSEVWQAVWHGRSAVLKLPVPGAESRFLAEQELLAALPAQFGRPEMLAVSTGAEPFCVMEFCRRADTAELAAHWAELREDLVRLHGCGVLHGDIRRSNLGVRADGRAVLFDFSHARRPAAPELRRDSGREMEQLRTLVLKGA